MHEVFPDSGASDPLDPVVLAEEEAAARRRVVDIAAEYWDAIEGDMSLLDDDFDDIDPADRVFFEPDEDFDTDEYFAEQKRREWYARRAERQGPRLAPREMKDAAYDRDGGCCVYCEEEVSRGFFRADHDIPYSRGGETTLDNIVTACVPCDLAKFTMTGEEFRAELEKRGIEWRLYAARVNYAYIKSRGNGS